MHLKHKNAIITGSTSGIGKAIALKLASHGVNITLNGFGDPKEIESTRLEIINNFGVKCFYHPADMSKPEEITNLVNFAKQNLGNVDIVINNAGIQHVAPVEDFPDEKWNTIIAINLSSAFHMVKHSVPLMKHSNWGRIINIASAHGLVASPFKSAYVAAKHGILGLTKTIALELAQHNITCNSICPGYVKTPLVENQIADTAKARNISEEQAMRDVILAAQPTKKFTTVEDIANYVIFLCSKTGDNISGAALTMDGGWTAQ